MDDVIFNSLFFLIDLLLYFIQKKKIKWTIQFSFK